MKILFITTAYSTSLEEYFRRQCNSSSYLQYAANTFQHSIIDGFVNNNAAFEVIAIPGLPTFPKRFRRFYTQRDAFTSNDKVVGISEKYCTLPFIKRYSIKYRLSKYVKDWIRRQGIHPDEKFAVLSYQPSFARNGALVMLKKKYPKMVIGTIVADFYDTKASAEYAKKNYGPLKRLQSYIERNAILKIYPKIDKYILLTAAMQEGIPAAVGHNIVMEGLANEEWIVDNVRDKSNQSTKIVAYTGQLGPNSCVDKLVDAFMLTKNEDYRLVITGKGLYTDYILEKGKQDKRILYKGIVSRSDMIELQRDATLLVNPRTPSTGMTKFSFPSKIMEYMAAGTPVLTYKLDGIPEEYYDVCYSLEEEGARELADKIDELLSKTPNELMEKAKNALLFLKDKKVAHRQVARIIEFLEQ